MDTEWFKGRLRDLGKTQEDLGAALGKERSVVSKMLTTGKPALRLDQVRIFAEVLEVHELEVLFRAGFWNNQAPSLIAAPILNSVEAGSFAETVPDRPKSRQENILIQYPRTTVFGLRVDGDSMDRVAPAGSYVIVDYSQKRLNDGDLGVFRQHGEATFKRYRRKGQQRWLEPDSTNPRHHSIFPDEDGSIEVIGRVIEIRPESRQQVA